MLRFRNAENLDAWRNSETWRNLLGEAQTLLAEKSSIEIETRESGPDGGVVEVIVTKVKPGKEEAYRGWETKIQQAQSKFPGYHGSYVQPPIAGELGWTTLMRFDRAEQLDTWLKSLSERYYCGRRSRSSFTRICSGWKLPFRDGSRRILGASGEYRPISAARWS